MTATATIALGQRHVFWLCLMAMVAVGSSAALLSCSEKAQVNCTTFQSPQPCYKGPLVITKGGTYSGNWESKSTDTPAVDIRTSEPVVIENANIRAAGFLINSQGHYANLTIRNTRGFALPPTPYTDYAKPRRFLNLDVFKNIVVEHCELRGVAGIYLGVSYEGDSTENETIRICFNKARNIDGRIYDGLRPAQFVQLNFKKAVPHAEIAWNQIINVPDSSAVEDNINIFNSRGTVSSPILIHDNYIEGAFPYPLSRKQYSGGGIIMDSPGTDSLAATAYIHVYNNQLVGLGNYCLGIAGGNHIKMYDNRAIVAAKFPAGERFHFWTSGIWAKDYYKKKNTFANSYRHNTLAITGQSGTWRNDIADSTFAAAATIDNVVLPGQVTKAMEKKEFERWQRKLAQNQITLGPATTLP